jgi:hypothetical protein
LFGLTSMVWFKASSKFALRLAYQIGERADIIMRGEEVLLFLDSLLRLPSRHQ